MSAEAHEIVEAAPIGSHAFNKDRTKVAVSPNNHEIHIYAREGNGWTLEDKLVQHDQRVTGIDWAPNSDRIVSCAQDRNAYVWVKDSEGKWKHTLVLLRINRAATCVKWSPQENKFAVGSGARLICICYFDEENDWWVAKHIKDNTLCSTVLSIDWHPNNAMVACGTADFKTIIFSCAIKGTDKKPAESAWATSEKMRGWGNVLQIYSTPCDGWVHGVGFSPSGTILAWVSHSSTINFVDSSKDTNAVQTLKLAGLPLRALVFTSENAVVAAGHDCLPTLFTQSGGSWKLERKIDEPKGEKKKEGRFAAMDRFRQLDSKATAGEDSGTELNTIHQNAISEVSKYEVNSSGQVTKVATSGVDGRLVIWVV